MQTVLKDYLYKPISTFQIRVNAVNPTWVKTEKAKPLMEEYPESVAREIERTPLKKIAGELMNKLVLNILCRLTLNNQAHQNLVLEHFILSWCL